MELRDLEYFAVIAEHGHLGRAAGALGLSQPALSKSLRRLEQTLEARLVKRTTKGVELTAEGSALLLRVRELRLSLRNISREIAEVSQGRVGYLRIGVGAAISEQFLSRAFAALLKDSPKTAVKVVVSDNDVMVPALVDGELDLVVNYFRPTPLEGVVQEELCDDEFVVCVTPGHRLATQKDVKLEDLREERWALTEPVLGASQKLNRVLQDAGLPLPRVAFESRSTSLRQRIVSASDLLNFTSRSAIREAGPGSGVKALAIGELTWKRPIGVIYRHETYLPPAVQRFVQILKETAKKLQK